MIIQESALDYRLDPQLQMHCSDEVGKVAQQFLIQDGNSVGVLQSPFSSVLVTMEKYCFAVVLKEKKKMGGRMVGSCSLVLSALTGIQSDF